jgi:hypothetical protein
VQGHTCALPDQKEEKTMPNGIVPITTAPPADVPPTTPGYGVTIGAIEVRPNPRESIPSFLTEAGGAFFPTEFVFKEYAMDVVNGQVVEVSLAGETIDWAASQIQSSGSLQVQFGVSTFYALAGKTYTARQYTFLRLDLALDEQGSIKTGSFVVRMKHF